MYTFKNVLIHIFPQEIVPVSNDSNGPSHVKRDMKSDENESNDNNEVPLSGDDETKAYRNIGTHNETGI